MHCKKHGVKAEARPRFDVEVHGDDGYITNCFGENAQMLFAFTTKELEDNTNEEGPTDQVFLQSKAATTPLHMFFIKPYIYPVARIPQHRLTIMAIENEVAKTPA